MAVVAPFYPRNEKKIMELKVKNFFFDLKYLVSEELRNYLKKLCHILLVSRSHKTEALKIQQAYKNHFSEPGNTPLLRYKEGRKSHNKYLGIPHLAASSLFGIFIFQLQCLSAEYFVR